MDLVRPEVTPRFRGVRPIFWLVLALAAALAVLVLSLHRERATPREAGADDWWSQHRAKCNPVEVGTLLDAHARAPAHYRAACLALAGKIDAARTVLHTLLPVERDRATSFVFTVAHPVADMGDDASAGPIMELVVELQPDQYMALYHAGMARAIAGDDAKAREYLTRFLAIYQNDDGWTGNARAALRSLDRPRTERTVTKGSEGSLVY